MENSCKWNCQYLEILKHPHEYLGAHPVLGILGEHHVPVSPGGREDIAALL